MTKTTRGQRFFLVRLACGDGVRRPEPLREFVARVKQQTGVVLHPSELSDIENDKPSKAVTAEHIEAVAAVDPKRRGKLWLGWDEDEKTPTERAGGFDVGELRPATPMPRSEKPVATPPVPAPVQEPAEGPAGRGGPKGRR